MPRPPDIDHAWSVRIQRTAAGDARAYARTQSFDVRTQASLRESDEHPSAVEYLLGALGGDLVCGFQKEAAARGLSIHAVELSIAGRLNNVLVHIGVIGEHGHPGFESITGTLYVGAVADEQEVDSAWRETLARSPLFNTLSRCATVAINLRVMP